MLPAEGMLDFSDRFSQHRSRSTDGPRSRVFRGEPCLK